MPSIARTGVALVMVALALGMVAVAAVPARGATQSLSLYGSLANGWGTTSMSETNPGPTLTVRQGDSVTITLTSTDGFTHQFLLDYNGNGAADAGEPLSPSFSTTTTVSFVASQAGTFTYYCLIHSTAMKGTFIVQGTGNPAPSNTPADSGNTLLIIGIVIILVAVVGVAALIFVRKR